jgi:hypothetical protein
MCPVDPSEPFGPDSFGGTDDESHYAAPELWRRIRQEKAEPAPQLPVPREPIEHELKTSSSMFNAIASGEKTFELRLNDRDFRVGDILVLRDYDDNIYTGRWRRVRVTHLTDGSRSGALVAGYVCMAIKKVDP